MSEANNLVTKLTNVKVASIINDHTIVINKGALDGVQDGQRFLIYDYAEEIIDPDTNKSLGKLEIVRGTGKVTHLQDSMATISSDMKTSPGRSIRRINRASIGGAFGAWGRMLGPEEVEEILPAEAISFDEGIKVGDHVKPV